MHTRVHAHTAHTLNTDRGRAPVCMALGTFVDPLLGVPPNPADDSHNSTASGDRPTASPVSTCSGVQAWRLALP